MNDVPCGTGSDSETLYETIYNQVTVSMYNVQMYMCNVNWTFAVYVHC